MNNDVEFQASWLSTETSLKYPVTSYKRESSRTQTHTHASPSLRVFDSVELLLHANATTTTATTLSEDCLESCEVPSSIAFVFNIYIVHFRCTQTIVSIRFFKESKIIIIIIIICIECDAHLHMHSVVQVAGAGAHTKDQQSAGGHSMAPISHGFHVYTSLFLCYRQRRRRNDTEKK